MTYSYNARVPAGQIALGRIFWVTFFVRAKKVTRCRSTTDAFDFDFKKPISICRHGYADLPLQEKYLSRRCDKIAFNFTCALFALPTGRGLWPINTGKAYTKQATKSWRNALPFVTKTNQKLI
jgi:hypothetical protein